MPVLGAIIGGGMSSRFGSDKAAALIDGVAMIEQVHTALCREVDAVVLCGRAWRDWTTIPDLPEPGLGPLGGVSAALHYGQSSVFAHVLTVPVDTLPLPAGLRALLSPAPATFSTQPLIGLWPTALSEMLSAHLRTGHRSVRGWIEVSGCRRIDDSLWELRNINRPGDLAGVSG